MLIPEWYTEKEGGTWYRVSDTVKQSWGWPDYLKLRQRSKYSVLIREGWSVHALAFDDPALGLGCFLRWDCINGFNQ